MPRRTGTNRGQGTGRGRQQGQGQSRSMQMRDGQDVLDEGFLDEPLCGSLPGLENLADDEEAIAFDDEEGMDPSSDDSDDDDGELRRRARASRAVLLSDVIGSRAPLVLLRLVEDAGTMRARVTTTPRTPDAAEALEELRFFVESRFRAAENLLSAGEWSQLLGKTPATIPQRLLLLTRLAIDGNARVVIENVRRADGSICPRYQFTPNDRVLERYVGKFAALPDGTPFSLRLLLLDRRGKTRDESGWSMLPWAIKLEALHAILTAERARGEACDDDTFRGQLQSKLKEMKVDIARPSWDDVKNLREQLKRNGLAHLFPNARQRQRSFGQEAP